MWLNRGMAFPSRTHAFRIFGLAIFLFFMALEGPSAAPTLEVRYIANEGFLVQAGDQKILIDGLLRRDLLAKYLKSGPALHDAAVSGKPPFDDIDLVLITHIHYDHFHPETTLAYMKQNAAPVICPEQVAETLGGDASLQGRIRAITPGPNQNQRARVAGFDVDVFRLRHSPFYEIDRRTGEKRDKHASIENVGFLVKLGGRTIFHVGDSGLDDPVEYPVAKIPSTGVDVLFAGFILRGSIKEPEAIVRQTIRPKNIVLMHLAPGGNPALTEEQRRAFPGLLIFKQPLERRNF